MANALICLPIKASRSFSLPAPFHPPRVVPSSNGEPLKYEVTAIIMTKAQGKAIDDFTPHFRRKPGRFVPLNQYSDTLRIRQCIDWLLDVIHVCMSRNQTWLSSISNLL
jgi:hypothetical protein